MENASKTGSHARESKYMSLPVPYPELRGLGDQARSEAAEDPVCSAGAVQLAAIKLEAGTHRAHGAQAGQ